MNLNILAFDLNEHSVLAALLIDSKDFCGDGSHFASLSTSDFAGGATRLQRFRHTERRQRNWHDVLSPAGHSGFIVVCGELKPNYFDVLITDHNMPLVSGLELIQHPRFKLEHTFLPPTQ
jgi:CheY-like chemotaxis protein